MEQKQAFEQHKKLRREVQASIPLSHRVYGNIVHWLTILSAIMALFAPIFILVSPSNNILNPNIIFGQIFSGANLETIWAGSALGGLPIGHYYLQNLGAADSWGMIAIAIGCSVGLWGLIPAIVIQIVKERDWLYAVLGTALLALIAFAMFGIL